MKRGVWLKLHLSSIFFVWFYLFCHVQGGRSKCGGHLGFIRSGVLPPFTAHTPTFAVTTCTASIQRSIRPDAVFFIFYFTEAPLLPCVDAGEVGSPRLRERTVLDRDVSAYRESRHDMELRDDIQLVCWPTSARVRRRPVHIPPSASQSFTCLTPPLPVRNSLGHFPEPH